MEVNPEAKILKETEAWALGQIRAAQESIALMAEIREGTEDWEIEELTRSIIFDEVQYIGWLKGEAEGASAARKESQRV